MKRFLIFAIALEALLGSAVSKSTAQDLSEPDDAKTRGGGTLSLAFSKDGRTLRELRTARGTGQYLQIRAINRDTKTGKIRQIFDLEPETQFLSRTSDGRIVVIAQHRGQYDQHARFFLFDTDAGSSEEIPLSWYDSEPPVTTYVSISGNGKLVATDSDSACGPSDLPLVVCIYDWRTKKLVGKKSAGFHAGGIDWGGITEDGKIEFSNNRAGSDLFDLKTGRSVVSYGPNSAASPDGKWIVELPGYLHGYEREDSVILSGEDGKKMGALEGLTLPEMADSWTGAFCGTTRKLVAWNADKVLVFQVPSGKRIANIPSEAWQDKNAPESDSFRLPIAACSWDGKRVAIRSGVRLTLHDLK